MRSIKYTRLLDPLDMGWLTRLNPSIYVDSVRSFDLGQLGSTLSLGCLILIFIREKLNKPSNWDNLTNLCPGMTQLTFARD